MVYIDGSWKVLEGAIPDDRIRLASSNVEEGHYGKLIFKKKGALEFFPANSMMCAFGQMSVKKASWKRISEGIILINLEGYCVGVKTFKYKIEYGVGTQNDGTIVLGKHRAVLIHEEAM